MLTSSILNSILGKNTLKENIEFVKNRDLDHLDFVNRQMKFNDVPVEAKESEWSEFDYGEYTAINKSYLLKSHDHLIYFINEVLKESNRIDHHPKITIDHRDIDIVLYTKDYNDVTESDLKLSRIIDEIYNDIFFIE
jgi:4a-hydroxytetrahydrobiopterin dehydratase